MEVRQTGKHEKKIDLVGTRWKIVHNSQFTVHNSTMNEKLLPDFSVIFHRLVFSFSIGQCRRARASANINKLAPARRTTKQNTDQNVPREPNRRNKWIIFSLHILGPVPLTKTHKCSAKSPIFPLTFSPVPSNFDRAQRARPVVHRALGPCVGPNPQPPRQTVVLFARNLPPGFFPTLVSTPVLRLSSQAQ